jgi:hypothetical protein
VWRAIRAQVVAEANSSCAVCGHRQQSWMVCDEDWRYAVLTPTEGPGPQTGRAILVGLRLLCPPCDQVVHIGHTETKYGKATARTALAHGAKVNGVSVADMRLLAEVMFEAWASVSSIGIWSVELDPALRARFPALAIVEQPPVEAS